MKIKNIAATGLLIGTVLGSRPVYADVPTVSSFMQNAKVQAALGWATIVIALAFLSAIIIGLVKVVPVAMSWWNRRGADEGTEQSKNYIIGWGLLIIVPIVITVVVGAVFGSDITGAVTTALSSIFK